MELSLLVAPSFVRRGGGEVASSQPSIAEPDMAFRWLKTLPHLALASRRAHPSLTKERNSSLFHFEKGSENWEPPTEKSDEPKREAASFPAFIGRSGKHAFPFTEI